MICPSFISSEIFPLEDLDYLYGSDHARSSHSETQEQDETCKETQDLDGEDKLDLKQSENPVCDPNSNDNHVELVVL